MNKIFLALLLAPATLAAQTLQLPALPNLDRIEKQEAHKQAVTAEIEMLTLEKSLRDLKEEEKRRLNKVLPTLIGIVSGQNGLVAEFVDQTGLRTMRIGETVAPGWTISAVRTDRIELRHTAGRKAATYVMILGSSEPVPAASI